MENEAVETLGETSPVQGNEEPSSSWDDVLSDDAAVVAEQAQAPSEDLDQKERSRLGRRLSKFEQEFSELKTKMSVLDKLDSFMSQQQQMQYRQPEPQRPVVDDEPLPEFITTPEDFEKYQTIRERRMERQNSQYANSYVGSIKQMSYVNPPMHGEIEQELLTNVSAYMKHTGDPVKDASINYRIAEANVLKKRMMDSTPRPNIKGGTTIPTGVTSTTRMAAPPKVVDKLDDYAAKFIKAIGASEDDDWVQQSIKRKDI